MEHKVTGCSDCPLYHDGQKYEFAHYCGHPNSPQHVSLFRSEPEIKLISEQDKFKDKDGYDHYKIIPITPEFCPLNKELITIKKDNNIIPPTEEKLKEGNGFKNFGIFKHQ